MRRILALFGAGIALGAAATYLVLGGGEHSGAPAAAPALGVRDSAPAPQGAERVPPRAIDFLTLALKPVSVTERAELYRLAGEADRGTLQSLLTQVAALPNVEGRRLALEALFTRYAEIDAPGAAAFARTLKLPTSELKPLFATWARHDARGALQALADLDSPPALTLGIAMLEALGNDDLNVARVLGAAPQIDADRFRIEAALAKAATEPAAGLELILGLPPSKAGTAFERLAVLWVERDVHGAFLGAGAIEDETLRNEFKAAVMRAAARLDPDALVDYVLALGPEQRDEALRSGALPAFAFIDPQRALRAAEGLPSELGAVMKRAALMTLARDDPLAALSVAEGLAAGIERDQLLMMIATSYGRTDPEGALAWTQTLRPAPPGVLGNVLAGLARVDPDRAIELAFEALETTPQRGASPLTVLVANGALDAEHMARVADRLLTGPASQRQALQALTQRWAERQPHDAARWLLARGDAVPRAAFGRAAIQLARTDPAAAIAYVDAVPAELRATWLSAVAEGYSQNDPRAAASWIARHRGEPGYDAGVAAITDRMSRTDPAAAARLFDSINVAEAPDAPAAARAIGTMWARQDPRAAAGWAGTLADDSARTTAVGAIAGQWVTQDPAGARGWALGLRAGAARDAALTQVLGWTTASTIDHVLVDAFSTVEAKQRGVTDAVRMLAPRDAAAARQLADEYITDPDARRAVERFIEQRRDGPLPGASPPRLPPGR